MFKPNDKAVINIKNISLLTEKLLAWDNRTYVRNIMQIGAKMMPIRGEMAPRNVDATKKRADSGSIASFWLTMNGANLPNLACKTDPQWINNRLKKK